MLPGGSSATLDAFVTQSVEPGSTVITDGWRGYDHLTELGYVHDRRSQRATRLRGEDVGSLLPGVHRVASVAKRWVLGTHQGSAEDVHMDSSMREFEFRFNRRTSRSRGLLFFRVMELAVDHHPARYRDLVARRRPGMVRPIPPATRGHPPSLDRPAAGRPWPPSFTGITTRRA